ncbi:MAG: hypothetical protein H0T65_25250 [Deltaproteobacteria bacterium]|nr:hypothetical protein [Deltaproteobacteria bacterium]
MEVRRARIYTDAPDAGGANKLALFLVDGKSGDGIEILRSDESAPASSERGHAWRLRSKVVLGGGAIALVASGIGFAITKDDGLETFTAKDFALDASYGASAIVGAGVFMWLRDTKSAGVGTSLLLGGGIAALISGGILLATDEDQQSDRKYYRNTATEGMIVGGVGVALTGIGTVLFVRQRGVQNDRTEPVVSLVNGRGYVGLAGRF